MNSSAEDQVGVALVGYGYWGANLARNIRSTKSLRLVGIADPSGAQRRAAWGVSCQTERAPASPVR